MPQPVPTPGNCLFLTCREFTSHVTVRRPGFQVPSLGGRLSQGCPTKTASSLQAGAPQHAPGSPCAFAPSSGSHGSPTTGPSLPTLSAAPPNPGRPGPALPLGIHTSPLEPFGACLNPWPY